MSRTIILTIGDEKLVSDVAPLMVSVYIRNLIKNLAEDKEESDGDDDSNDDKPPVTEISITNVKYDTMKKVLDWCQNYYDVHGEYVEETTAGSEWTEDTLKKHRSKAFDAPLDNWDREFLQVPPPELTDIISAANFLNIQPLLDAGCKVVAEHFRGKSPSEVIAAFASAAGK